jgi:hypothetical protein
MSGAEGGRGLGGGAPAFHHRPPAICRWVAHGHCQRRRRCQRAGGLRQLSQDLVESLHKPPEKGNVKIYIKKINSGLVGGKTKWKVVNCTIIRSKRGKQKMTKKKKLKKCTGTDLDKDWIHIPQEGQEGPQNG